MLMYVPPRDDESFIDTIVVALGKQNSCLICSVDVTCAVDPGFEQVDSHLVSGEVTEVH